MLKTFWKKVLHQVLHQEKAYAHGLESKLTPVRKNDNDKQQVAFNWQ